MKKFFICFFAFSAFLIFHNPGLQAQEDPVEKFKKAAQADPKDYAPHFGLAQTYHKMGIYDKAVKEYKKNARSN